MTLGIIGTRRRDSQADLAAVYVEVEKLQCLFEIDRIVSGGCPQGGDRFAELIAECYGLPITIHRPQWDLYGRAAGFHRNTNIAWEADVLLAVVAKDRRGGTEDTIRKFQKQGKTRLFLV